MKKTLLLVPIILASILFGNNTGNLDNLTKETCYQQSLVDHKRYILPERWRDEWKYFDWYQSCIDNIREISPIK